MEFWHETWMDLAFSVAQHSHDNKMKVGCVIVSTDNTTVLSIGYNGDEIGGANTPNEKGPSGFIHAEENALIKLPYQNQKKKAAYITHEPCLMCTKKLVNAGINEVYWSISHFKDPAVWRILKRQGIKACHMLRTEEQQ